MFVDENGNGTIDLQELKDCFRKLEISFAEEEIDDLFKACDLNEDKGMNFNEFIVLLCLVYLLKKDSSAHHDVSILLYRVHFYNKNSFSSLQFEIQECIFYEVTLPNFHIQDKLC